jgi:alanyl aminopeptidase
MEHPGAITFAEGILLVDSQAATVGQKRVLARVMAHELAHQWFGNLVTMEWWDDLWLNEAFADWMGDKIAERVYPQFKLSLAELESVQGTMSGDAAPSTLAIRRPVESTANLLENVGVIYNKGKSVLSMFELWIGAEAFRAGVIDYIEANAWGNATAGDLWAALSKASGRDVASALATFIEQPGLPLVTIEPVGPAEIRVQQRRFLNAGVTAPDQTWTIPITLKYADGKGVRTQSILLDSPARTISLPASGEIAWVLPNARSTGYYRWSAPPEWMLAMANAGPAALDARERVSYVGNATALLHAGKLSGADYLAVLGRFASDPEPQVVSMVIEGLDEVKTAFVPPELEEPFAAYVRRTLRPALERFGASRVAGEEEVIAAFRPQLLNWLGYHGRDERIVAYAESLAAAYLADPASIDPSLAGVALNLSAMHGDRARFDEYRRRFETARVPADRFRFLAALGGFRDPALRDEALAYALSGPLRTNELFVIPQNVGASAQGEEVAFDWMMTNFDAIASRLPPEFVGFLPFSASGCSAERLATAKAFFAQENHQGPGTETTLAKVSDRVNDCVRLRAREGAAVAQYLVESAGGGALGASGGGASGGR